MDDVASELLVNIPTGAELVDPRAGEHNNVALSAVSKSDDGEALLVVFTGLTNSEGGSFDYTLRVGFPNEASETWKQRQFRDTLQQFGLVEKTDKRARFATTDEDKDEVVAKFSTLIGTSYNIKLTESKSGFLNFRLLRS